MCVVNVSVNKRWCETLANLSTPGQVSEVKLSLVCVCVCETVE